MGEIDGTLVHFHGTSKELKELIKMKDRVDKGVSLGYLDKDTLEPIKCPYCNSTIISKKNIKHDTDYGYLCSYVPHCDGCNKDIGTWGYGGIYDYPEIKGGE